MFLNNSKTLLLGKELNADVASAHFPVSVSYKISTAC
jgi:hypothetical protein